MSEALANFALYVVPRIVEKHHGTLIYAGGDDVLALLPRRTAVACAGELRRAFRGDPQGNHGAPKGYYRHEGRDLLMMGPTATLSAGIAVVHYKEDLRAALQAARNAEKSAKNSGRDLLAIAALRRSGERSQVLCPWDMVEDVGRLVDAFGAGASDRWAYHLRREAETLEALPVEAMRAEIQRQVRRADLKTRKLIDCSDGNSAAEELCGVFDRYLKLTERCWTMDAHENEEVPKCEAFGQFIQLCQTASFLARGEERR